MNESIDDYIIRTFKEAADKAIKEIEAAKPQFMAAVDAARAEMAEKTKRLDEIAAWSADNICQAAIKWQAYEEKYARVYGTN